MLITYQRNSLPNLVSDSASSKKIDDAGCRRWLSNSWASPKVSWHDGYAQATSRDLHLRAHANVAVRRNDDPARLRRASKLFAPSALWDAVLGQEIATQDPEVSALLPEVACGRFVIAAKGAPAQ